MIRPFLLDTWSLKNLTKCKEVRKGSDQANSAQCTLSKHVRVSIRSECAKLWQKFYSYYLRKGQVLSLFSSIYTQRRRIQKNQEEEQEVNSSIRIGILITYGRDFRNPKEFLKDFIKYSDNSKPRGLRMKSFQSCFFFKFSGK